jgi:hypothetical protein
MKHTNPVAAKIAAQIEEIRLAAPEDDPAIKYAENFKEIENTMKSLQAKLKKHQAAAKAKPKSWGLVNDITRVNQDLQDINDMLP